MKILITGGQGQLGFDVCRRLDALKIEYIAPARDIINLENAANSEKFIRDYAPNAIIHCGAYTKVDLAETNADLCYRINSMATGYLANLANKINAKFMFISSDYVFGNNNAYPNEIDDKKNPLNIYGKSKLLGEECTIAENPKHFIVRTSWVFGKNGNNFVKTMLAQKNKTLDIISTQIGSPTYSHDLSILLCDIIQTEKYGIYHATNTGYCSWADFASEILPNSSINKINSYPSAATRPNNSRLSAKSLQENGFNPLPSWQDALKRFLKELSNDEI